MTITHRITPDWVFALSAMIVMAVGVQANQNQQEEAASLIEKTRELTDIRAKGSPSFQLLATVRLLNLSGGEVDGKYEEFRDFTGQWRRTFKFPSLKYLQIEVGDEHTMWSASPSRYDPYAIFRLKQALDLGSHLTIGKNERVVKYVRRAVGQTTMSCVELKWGRGGTRQVCFDPDSRTMRRVEKVDGPKCAYEYAEYFPIISKSFPKVIREVEFGKVFLEVQIDELALQVAQDPSLFTPPQKAMHWPICSDPSPPQPLDQPKPRGPRAYSDKVPTFLPPIVYFVVGIDGKPHRVTPIQADNVRLAASAINMISRHWTYRPAKCGETPVPAPLIIRPPFKLLW